MPQTVQQIVDQVRLRHPAFETMPDGGVMRFVDARQRTLLLQYAKSIEGLISTSVQIAVQFNGNLVGSVNGVPSYATTYADGWAIHQDQNGVPYVDFTEPKIAGDPFGQNGGVPGFPLPTDFLKLIGVTYVLNNGAIGPVDVLHESARLVPTRITVPTVFVSGSRLVPVRPLASGNAADAWTLPISSLQLSYVVLPVLVALADLLTTPMALTEALISGVAELLGSTSREVTPADRAALAGAARRAEAVLVTYDGEVLEPTQNYVQYRP